MKPPQKKARKEKKTAPRKEEASPKGGGQATGLVLVEREVITQQQEGGKRLPPLEDEEEEMSGGDPVREQEEAEAQRTDRRADFETKLKKLMDNRVTIKEAAKVLMKIIPSLGTKLGRFYTLLEKAAVAPKELTAPAELLPISLKAIGRLKGPWDMDERAWIHWICWILNFNFCTGWEKASNLQHPSELTTAQLAFIKERIYPAVKRLTEFNTKLPALEDILKELHRKGQDYDGTSWVQMEELEFEKVVECWPSKEGAAVQPITRLLEGETLKAVESPLNSILPFAEWPRKRTKSYVRASDEVWNRLIAEGFIGVVTIGLHQRESKTGKGNSCYRCLPYWCRELHREKIQITSGRGGHEQCLHRVPSGHRRAWRVGSTNELPMAMWIKTLLLGLLAESSQILPLFRAKGSDK